MKVYVVCFLQSYDGPLYEAVFSSYDKARQFIEQASQYKTDEEWYSIEEEELDATIN